MTRAICVSLGGCSKPGIQMAQQEIAFKVKFLFYYERIESLKDSSVEDLNVINMSLSRDKNY